MNKGKLFDETQAPELTVPAQAHEASVGSSSPFDSKRRRLIQGAAGIAPVVLTLRSGALAAAASGCAPTIQQTQLITKSGKTGYIQNTTDVIADTNVCVTNFTACPNSNRVQGGPVDGVVKNKRYGLACVDQTTGNLLGDGPVAILSVNAVASLS